MVQGSVRFTTLVLLLILKSNHMQKLLRLAILSAVFLISFVFFFCLFPSLVFILGGEFLAVLHHPAYCLVGGFGWAYTIGYTLYTQFDSNYFVKN